MCRIALIAGFGVAIVGLLACDADVELVVASYNVENLFDAIYDGSEYASFDPRTDNWGPNRYARSLENTARVIRDLGNGEGADILALQEIENGRVLSDLSDELESLGYRYKILVSNSGPFHSAVFSRFPVTSVRTHALSLPWAAPGRYILEIDVEWPGQDLRLFVNHWHSMVGGAEESEPSRREAAAVLVRRIRATYADEGPAVIVVGDLNTNADEYVRTGGRYPTALRPEKTLGRYDARDGLYLSPYPESARATDAGVVLYSPWKSRLHGLTDYDAGGPKGTYVFRGAWNTLDHILLGRGFSGCAPGARAHAASDTLAYAVPDTEAKAATETKADALLVTGFEVIAEPYMLTGDGAPMRWRSDRATGYSDHLPIQITLRADEGRDQVTKDVCRIHPPLSLHFSSGHGEGRRYATAR